MSTFRRPGRLDPRKRLDVDDAIGRLKAGGIVAYPTETYLGLGVNAMDATAVESLRALKGRGGKPISVIIADAAMLDTVAYPLSKEGAALARMFWPGPLTLVVQAKEVVPLNLRAGGGTIGVRVSSHIVARALAAGLGGPITSTSCNLAGEAEPTRPEKIDAAVLQAISGYLEGVAPGGQPSTIIDLTGTHPVLIRAGAIALDRLREVVPRLEVTT